MELISRQSAIDAFNTDVDSLIVYGTENAVTVKRYLNGVLEKIKQLPPKQPESHWIPVTERLPEYGTEVVTYNRDEEFEINHIIDEEDGEWFLNGAIAWMPLPEPNKGVTT